MIISGGQTGADVAGLYVAKRFGIETGGMMPLGFKTLTGPRPDFAQKFGMTESSSPEYPPRTEWNVQNSDGTIRLACDFESAGEKCTLKFLKKHNKPYFDVQLDDPPSIEDFLRWMHSNQILTLNVAGNSEQTYAGAFTQSASFLMKSFLADGYRMTYTKEELLVFCGLNWVKDQNLKIFSQNGEEIQDIYILGKSWKSEND
jgi:hypothetical protein